MKPRQTWRPLGKLLVESGFRTEGELDRALAEQLEHPELRLGEILVDRGYLSGPALGRALAEQHGVDLAPENELDVELETVISHALAGEPVYRVYEVVLEPAYQTGLDALRERQLPRGGRLRRRLRRADPLGQAPLS